MAPRVAVPMPMPSAMAAPVAAPAVAPAAPEPAAQTPAAAPEPKGTEVTAPMVGVFYAAPAPGDEPFVHVGSKVKAGETLCIIEDRVGDIHEQRRAQETATASRADAFA